MIGIQNSNIGPRIILPAEVSTRNGQNIDRALDLVERSLIEHYLSEGYDLHNVQGTRITGDEISFGGNSQGRQTCPRRIVMPRR